MITNPLRLANALLRRVLVLLAVKSARWRTVSDVRIAALPFPGVEEDEALRELEEVLRHLGGAALWRLRPLRGAVGLLAASTGYREESRGYFLRSLNVFILDGRYLVRGSVTRAQKAGTLVYLGALARMPARGIWWIWCPEGVRRRILGIAEKQERAFLERAST